MPTYSFYNTETDEEFDMLMKYSEREVFLKENSHIQPIITAATIVSGVSITNKVPNGFKEVLSKISDAHPGSHLAKRQSKKSIKQVKTERVIEKHVKKYVDKTKRI